MKDYNTGDENGLNLYCGNEDFLEVIDPSPFNNTKQNPKTPNQDKKPDNDDLPF